MSYEAVWQSQEDTCHEQHKNCKGSWFKSEKVTFQFKIQTKLISPFLKFKENKEVLSSNALNDTKKNSKYQNIIKKGN